MEGEIEKKINEIKKKIEELQKEIDKLYDYIDGVEYRFDNFLEVFYHSR